MKHLFLMSLLGLITVTAVAQSKKKKTDKADTNNNTLLWRISGKDIKTPSYLFGTIHILCADDIQISDSLKKAISKADNVYLELNLDNILEMMSVINKMKMNGDTTLADLLTADEYERVKTFFQERSSMLPFQMLETYKPMLAASTLMQGAIGCENQVAMEHLVMSEAKEHGVKIKGLETMAYQISIFDSIPYKLQAKQLLQYVDNYSTESAKGKSEFDKIAEAYRMQQLDKMEKMALEDEGTAQFADLLLYNRNINWVKKLEELLADNSLVIAVGAGHLPGKKGVINLLRQAGYKVEPVKNDMSKKLTREL